MVVTRGAADKHIIFSIGMHPLVMLCHVLGVYSPGAGQYTPIKKAISAGFMGSTEVSLEIIRHFFKGAPRKLWGLKCG